MRRSADLKIVMLSSIGVRGDAARGRHLQIQATLTKPLQQSEFLLMMTRLFRSGARSGAASQHDLTTSQPAPLGSPIRILVAEDNPINQLLAKRMLEKQGHTVVIVPNGVAAVEANERSEFDLILMDVQMPGMDGYEATRAIRQRETKTRTPIIALTAHAMASDQQHCLDAGMDAYIAKPIDAGELTRAIEGLCKSTDSGRAELVGLAN